MTLLVGILCTDGVVLASDSEATFGNGQFSTIGQQEVDKVFRICGETGMFAGTGAIGIAQVLIDSINRAWRENQLGRCDTPVQFMNKIGHTIQSAAIPYLQSAQAVQNLGQNPAASMCKSLIAVLHKGSAQLFQFDVNGAPEQATPQLPFVSLGSGQMLADSFLAFLKRVLWNNSQPNLAEGRLVATWVLEHVSTSNPGGVGGPSQIWTLTPNVPHVAKLTSEHVQEHLQQIASAQAALVNDLRGRLAMPESPPPMPVAPA